MKRQLLLQFLSSCDLSSEPRQNLVRRNDDPATILEFHEDFAGEDFLRKDPALALARQQPGAHGRQLLLEFLIDILLEAQAAFQSAAASRYFRWIERRFLQFGHAHRYGRHACHVRIATHWFAAITVVGQELGLIADTDLPHFDARFVLARQVLDKFSKIHALLGQEVENDALTAEDVLSIHQLHLQLAFLDNEAAPFQLLALRAAQAFQLLPILRADRTDDGAPRRFLDQFHGSRIGLAQDLANFVTAVGAYHHLVASAVR